MQPLEIQQLGTDLPRKLKRKVEIMDREYKKQHKYPKGDFGRRRREKLTGELTSPNTYFEWA